MLANDYKKIREELDNCAKPLFFFHDDADGLCSFLLLYKYKQEGKGIVIKARPIVNHHFLSAVQNYAPDKIFILDIALVEQEFIDKARVPVVIIDHHELLELDNVRYFNPRKYKKNYPVSYTCYKAVNENLWIGLVGCIGDWFIPDFAKKFQKQFPDLLPEIKSPGAALFNTKIGKLAEILSFSLKGPTSEVFQVMKVLTRINSPYELLDNSSPQANFILRRYHKIKKTYSELLAKITPAKDKIILFIYPSDKMSFTGELSNEILFKNPEKIIIIAREKSGELKCSLRSSKIKILPILKKALIGIDGYGGGHEHATGACIKKHDFQRFLDNLRRDID